MRNVLVLVAALAVVLLVGGIGYLAYGPAPVAFGSSSGHRERLFIERIPPDTSSAGEPVEYRYLMQPGGEFETAISLRNTGPIPITILGSEQPADAIAFRMVSLAMMEAPAPDTFTDPVSAPALTSVELAPGDEVRLWARYRIHPACPGGTSWLGGSGGGRSVIPIRYRELGIERTVDLEMPFRVMVMNPGPDTIELCLRG